MDDRHREDPDYEEPTGRAVLTPGFCLPCRYVIHLSLIHILTLPVKLDEQKVNRERLEELLDILDLRDRAAHLPRQLSGGQQQRAAIGRARCL